MQTRPGRHTGPTAGGGEATSGREGSQQQPKNKTKARQQRDPTTHKKERSTDRETPTNTPAETPDRQHHEPRKAKPERERKTEQRTKDGRESKTQTKFAPEKQTCKKKGGHER